MHRPSRWISPALVAIAIVLVACGGTQTAATDPATTEAASPTHDMASHTPSDMATPSPEPMEPTDSPEPTEVAADEPEVTTPGVSFSPGEITVSAGTTVRFTNPSDFPHTVTNGTGGRPAADAAFDEPLGPGASITITFDEPGTYEVTCKFHPEMQMRVVVEG